LIASPFSLCFRLASCGALPNKPLKLPAAGFSHAGGCARHATR
jgi:hypothetical protein